MKAFFKTFISKQILILGYTLKSRNRAKNSATIIEKLYDKNIPTHIPIPITRIKNGKNNTFKIHCKEVFISKKLHFLRAINIPLSRKNIQATIVNKIKIREYTGNFRISSFGAKKSIKRIKITDKIAETAIENKKAVEINLLLSSEFIEGRNLMKVGSNPDVEKTTNNPIAEINAVARPTSSGVYKRAAINQKKNPVRAIIIFESIK